MLVHCCCSCHNLVTDYTSNCEKCLVGATLASPACDIPDDCPLVKWTPTDTAENTYKPTEPFINNLSKLTHEQLIEAKEALLKELAERKGYQPWAEDQTLETKE